MKDILFNSKVYFLLTLQAKFTGLYDKAVTLIKTFLIKSGAGL